MSVLRPFVKDKDYPRVIETRLNFDGWLTVHLSITLVWSSTWCTKFLFIYM